MQRVDTSVLNTESSTLTLSRPSSVIYPRFEPCGAAAGWSIGGFMKGVGNLNLIFIVQGADGSLFSCGISAKMARDNISGLFDRLPCHRDHDRRTRTRTRGQRGAAHGMAPRGTSG
jgi:hypothetical protein